MSKSLKVFVLLVIVVMIGAGVRKNEAAPLVEICDNGIDDDNDGLTDINDPDCSCHINGDTLLFTSSLIPNSSFEDRYCCPTNIAQLSCAKRWIQASDATTDYFNTCGYMGDQFRSVPPMPLPAGNGFVAFRDESDYKEYVGACLNSPLKDGIEYRLQFYVGFGKPGQVWKSVSPFHLSIFGAKYCSDLPFGIAGTNYTLCPMGLPNWIEITDTYISGKDEWVKVTVDFTMNQDIEVIAIGPSCDKVPNESYYFLDGLQLAEKKAFEVKQLDVRADLCKEYVTLTAPSFPGIQYQWYKDGVAIIGATSRIYTVNAAPEGDYQVRMMINGDCLLTDAYHYKYLNEQRSYDTIICENAVLDWEGQTISAAGTYTATYKNRYGCDSTLSLTVKQNPTAYRAIDTMICAGETLDYLGKRFYDAGTHQIMLTTALGCDSLIEINLDFHPEYHISIDTSICEGDTFKVGDEKLFLSGEYSFNLTTRQACDSVIDLKLNVNQIVFNKIDTTICRGDQIFVGGQWIGDKGSYDIALTSKSGCDSVIQLKLKNYEVYYFERDTAICYGDVINKDNQRLSTSGTYTFNYSSIHGCDSVRVINLTVMPELTTDIILDQSISCNGADDGRLEVIPGGGNGSYSYTWSNKANTRQISKLKPGKYQVTVTDGMGCEQIRVFELKEPEVLSSSLEIVRPTCLDPEGGMITVKEINGGTSPYKVMVNTVPANPSTMIDDRYAPGTYEVKIIDDHGCEWTEMVDFAEPGQGNIELLADEQNVRRGQSVQLQLDMTDLTLPVKNIHWKPENLISCQNCENPELSIDRSNLTVEVQVTDHDECIYTRSLSFKADGKFFVPNVFTPNGDSFNDVFKVFSDDEAANIVNMRIFDRRGELVFYAKNLNINDDRATWNGNYRGEKLDPATFVYMIEIVDQLGISQVLTGDVTLIR